MRFLIFLFGFIALYDGFTTFIGTAEIMDGSIIVSLVFAIIILAIVGSTAIIWSDEIEDEFLGIFLRIIWFVAIIYDLFTSYVGNLEVIMNGDADDGQLFILLGVTILVSSSPAIFSYFLISDFD